MENKTSIIYQYQSPADNSVHSFSLKIHKKKITCIQPADESAFLKPFTCEIQQSSGHDLFSRQQKIPFTPFLGYIQGSEQLGKVKPSDYTLSVRNIIFSLENLVFHYESLLSFAFFLNYHKLYRLLQKMLNNIAILRNQISDESDFEKWIITGGLSVPMKTGFLEKLYQTLTEQRRHTNMAAGLIFNSQILKDRLNIKSSPVCVYDSKTDAPIQLLATGNIAQQIENRFNNIFYHLSKLEQTKDEILLKNEPLFSPPGNSNYPTHPENLEINTAAGKAFLNIVRKKEHFIINIKYPFVNFWERINHLVLDIQIEDIDLFISSINPAVKGFYR